MPMRPRLMDAGAARTGGVGWRRSAAATRQLRAAAAAGAARAVGGPEPAVGDVRGGDPDSLGSATAGVRASS